MSDIDYEAIVNQLQDENERLRVRLVQAMKAPDITIDMDAVRSWLIENYIVIAACALLLSVVLSMMDVIVRK